MTLCARVTMALCACVPMPVCARKKKTNKVPDGVMKLRGRKTEEQVLKVKQKRKR